MMCEDQSQKAVENFFFTRPSAFQRRINCDEPVPERSGSSIFHGKLDEWVGRWTDRAFRAYDALAPVIRRSSVAVTSDGTKKT
jgi:hypothetical protein